MNQPPKNSDLDTMINRFAEPVAFHVACVELVLTFIAWIATMIAGANIATFFPVFAVGLTITALSYIGIYLIAIVIYGVVTGVVVSKRAITAAIRHLRKTAP